MNYRDTGVSKNIFYLSVGEMTHAPCFLQILSIPRQTNLRKKDRQDKQHKPENIKQNCNIYIYNRFLIKDLKISDINNIQNLLEIGFPAFEIASFHFRNAEINIKVAEIAKIAETAK